MKKVRKDDLVELIAQYYCDFIRLMPIDEIVDGNHGVSIIVNSICIHVTDYNFFCTEREQITRMQDFAKHIEEITFGNLKVTYEVCKVQGISCLSRLDIANAYEVVE